MGGRTVSVNFTTSRGGLASAQCTASIEFSSTAPSLESTNPPNQLGHFSRPWSSRTFKWQGIFNVPRGESAIGGGMLRRVELVITGFVLVTNPTTSAQDHDRVCPALRSPVEWSGRRAHVQYMEFLQYESSLSRWIV